MAYQDELSRHTLADILDANVQSGQLLEMNEQAA